jgi:hypothetical protein
MCLGDPQNNAGRIVGLVLFAISSVMRAHAADHERRVEDPVLAKLKSNGAEIRDGAILDDAHGGVMRYVEVRFRKDSWAASSRLAPSLKNVTQNVAVSFYGVSLSAGDLQKISRCKNVFSISFRACRLPDDGVRQVATLPNLRELVLAHGNLTNSTLAHFCAHRKLRALSLEGRAFSDEAIVHLRKMDHLSYINLFAHGFSAKGVAELRKALPGVHLSVSVPSFDVQRKERR